MRIVFVRHGHPDYQNDCLTDAGRKQAKAVAERLRGEKFQKIYSSTRGRALETAEYIAEIHNLNVSHIEFMREVEWGSKDDAPLLHNGNPWHTADDMVMNGQNLLSSDGENEEPFCRNVIIPSGRIAWQGADSLLEELGYKREGLFYRVCEENDNTYAIVSHGGSSAVVISHLFNIPLPFVCYTIRPDFTAITIVNLNGTKGTLIAPKFELVNDARHIETLNTEISFGK